jgi:hypothetical protein
LVRGLFSVPTEETLVSSVLWEGIVNSEGDASRKRWFWQPSAPPP